MKRALLLVTLLFVSCATVVQPPAEPVHVVIVGTTDVHGWFAGHQNATVPYGGTPLLASYLNVLRAENPGRVLLVDSGDMYQGTLESNLFEGEPVVKAYNLLGYTAAAVGNHEFDYGPVGPDSVARKPGDDELGALKHNAQMSNFPFLSANMTEKATGRVPSWAKPWVIVESGGAKIGIIGLSTPDTPNVTMASNVVALKFGDPVPATLAAMAELRARNVDAIIVIAHMGGRCRNLRSPEKLDSCEHDQEAMRFLEALPPGSIDGYFAGHTHAQMRNLVNGIPALQGQPYSGEFSTLDLWIDARAHRVVRNELREHTMICAAVFAGTQRCDPRDAPPGATLVARTFDGKAIAPEPTVTAAIAPYLEKVEKKRNEKLGIVTSAPFTRGYLRDSALGDLLTDAFRQALKTDVAFINSGGIRANLKGGELVYSDVFEVSPFDNYPVVVGMTGTQIERLLRSTTSGERGILQVSGLRYSFDEAKDADKPGPVRDRLVSVSLENGQPLDPNKVYTVVMPDFLAAGGDGAEIMKEIPAERITWYQERPMREVLIDAMKAMPQPLQPEYEPRITVLNPRPNGER